jgi:hypothetical protein
MAQSSPTSALRTRCNFCFCLEVAQRVPSAAFPKIYSIGPLAYPHPHKIKLQQKQSQITINMAKVLTILTWPQAFRIQVDKLLRDSGYGDMAVISKWCTEQGKPISKSALHRYCLSLRQVDAEMGIIVAKVALKRTITVGKRVRQQRGGTPPLRIAGKMVKLIQIGERITQIASTSRTSTAPELLALGAQIRDICAEYLPKNEAF